MCVRANLQTVQRISSVKPQGQLLGIMGNELITTRAEHMWTNLDLKSTNTGHETSLLKLCRPCNLSADLIQAKTRHGQLPVLWQREFHQQAGSHIHFHKSFTTEAGPLTDGRLPLWWGKGVGTARLILNFVLLRKVNHASNFTLYKRWNAWLMMRFQYVPICHK